jgi:hypothetical protein
MEQHYITPIEVPSRSKASLKAPQQHFDGMQFL